MAGVNDLAPHLRGTVNFGGHDFHYRRSVLNGQVYPHPGPDERDWAKIDGGAVDYADIAAMEHQQNPDGGPEVHDGPKIRAACPVCNGTEGALPTKDADAALLSLAQQGNEKAIERAREKGLLDRKPAGDTLVMPVMTPERQAAVDKAQADRDAAAEQERIQALADQAAKAQIKQGVNPEVAVKEPSQQPYHEAVRQERAVSEQAAGITGAADPAFNAGIPPTDPGVVAGATPDVQELAADLDATFALPEGKGRDPWTGEVVDITRNPGADAEAPYGRKKNGEPRRRSGTAK